MSQDDVPISIDDDTLRGAARAAWGDQSAPAALRQRILMAMNRTVLEEPSIPATTRSPRFWDRWPKSAQIAAGIAALLLISVGATWAILDYENTPHYARHIPDFAAPPATPSLYAMLVARHDDFAAGAEAPEAVPATQPQSVRESFATRVHHSVWAPDLTKLGWRLTGVRIYPINGVSAVVFNFTRGTDAVSAFSLPVSSAAGGDACATTLAPDIDLLVGNRSFSSFSVADGVMYALVGSRGAGAFPQADLRALLTQFRDDASCRSACLP